MGADGPKIQLNSSSRSGVFRRGKSSSGESRPNVAFGIMFCAVVAVVFIVWLIFSGTAGDFFAALATANVFWLLLGGLFFCGFFGLDMLCYKVAGRLTNSHLGFRDLLSVAATGIVFAFLTPGQSGAAPAQIVRLSHVGLKVGDATAVQLTKFFIYQAGVTVLGALVLAFRAPYFVERFGDIVLVSVFSFAVHLAIMAALVAMVFFPNAVRATLHFLVRLFSRTFKVIKDPDSVLRKIDEEVDGYSGAVHRAIRQGKIVVLAILVNLFQLCCLYCIPYCVLRSLGVESVDFVTSLCASAFIQLIMTAVPLPGGTGGAEAGFSLFFGPELGAFTAAAVVLWRMISYYLPIIVSIPMLGLRSRPFVVVKGSTQAAEPTDSGGSDAR